MMDADAVTPPDSDEAAPLATIRWNTDRTGVVILDQTALPGELVERELTELEAYAEAIVALRVRGAPLIGITAAMAVAALATRAVAEGVSAETLVERIDGWCVRLAATRPTAVNLTWALGRLRDRARKDHSDAAALAEVLAAEAAAILEQDRRMCRSIGDHAVELLSDGSTALTHCNAGALATGGIGTALAPFYVAKERGWTVHVYADETRPLLQGSRLTAWELARAGIDVTVISDGMPAALLAAERVDAVLVGADRIAANGDVANKVGTYGLAVLARHHGVPFYVLAPSSTIDLDTPDGAAIPIEFRDPDEIRRGFGAATAPAGAAVWSPAFDVTPSDLVTAIVTEHGVCRPPTPECLREAVEAAGR